MAKESKELQKTTKSATITRDRIIDVVNRLESTVKAWESSTDETLFRPFRGRTVRALSQSVEEVAMELFDLCDTADIEREAWPLVLAIDLFDDAMQKFADRWQAAPDATDPNGGPELWNAYTQVIDARKSPRKHKLEPIQQLVAENVSRHQIAKMYGFVRADGTPDLDKLQQEISAPGTHYNPDTFVHPRDKKFWENVESQWQARVAAIEQSKTAVDKKKKKREAPETVEELLQSGVNVEQIVKMKKVDPDKVRQIAAEMGASLDGRVVHATYMDAQRSIAANRDAGLRNAMQLATMNTHSELGLDRDGRIRAMHKDGHPPRAIVEALKNAFPEIRYQDVAYLLAKDKSPPPTTSAEIRSPDDAIAAI